MAHFHRLPIGKEIAHWVSANMQRIISLLGSFPADRAPLRTLAAEFGWHMETADSLESLEGMHDAPAVAVLFEAAALEMPVEQALRVVKRLSPGSLPVVCHRPSDHIHWPELAEAGAFHALLLPLKTEEVRQTLGFVRKAQRADPALRSTASLRCLASATC